jgi:hypothetical protein
MADADPCVCRVTSALFTGTVGAHHLAKRYSCERDARTPVLCLPLAVSATETAREYFR